MSTHLIDPKWNLWLLRSVNSQLRLRLDDVTLVYQDQEAPNFASLEKWIEISFFGPLYDFHNRTISATLQLQLRAFMKNTESIYSMADLTGKIAHAVSLPILVPELSRCFSNLGVRTMPKGRIFSPQAAVASEIGVTLQIQLTE